jgi:hypothetical protein
MTINWFDDPTNTQGAGTPTDTPGTLIDTFVTTAAGDADAIAHNGLGPVADPGAFSMTQEVIITLKAHGELINRGTTEIKTPVPAPEPATLSVLGLGLIGLGALARRRR